MKGERKGRQIGRAVRKVTGVVEIDGRHAHARACRPSIPRVTQVFRRQTGCRRRKSRRRRQIRRIRAQNLFFTFVCFVSARRFSSDTSIT